MAWRCVGSSWEYGLHPVGAMAPITRHVDWRTLAAMLRQPRRAYLAGVSEHGLDLIPVAIRFDGERFWLRDLPELASWQNGPVRLTVDDGLYWFELRAVTLRGVLEPPVDGWREVRPQAISAWDYGSLRESNDAPA